MKFISIIIPVFNAEKYLPETFRSLSLQDDFELILVDDGSTDSSLQICREYAATKSNVKVFTQSNGGPSKARNFGVSQATGEYITFLDADDSFTEDALEKSCNYLRKNPVDILFQKIVRLNLKGESLYLHEYQDITIINHSELQNMWCKNDSRIAGYLCGKIYRKSLLENVKIPEDMRFAEDMFALTDIFRNAQSVCFFSEGAYIYYERENTPTTSDWNITKSKQLVKSYLHRWIRTIQDDFPLRNQIFAWYWALVLFLAEKKMFPDDDWEFEREVLQKNNYSFFTCWHILPGLRKKIGLIKCLFLLRSSK